MSTRLSSRGFTLIEVLVALAIVAIALAAAIRAVDLMTDGNGLLRDKSLALADLFIELVESRCERFGLTLMTPREHARRGSHVSFEHAQGYAIVQALIDRGVIGDYREPGILRFGFTPLYTRFVEVWDAVQALLEILQSEAWKEPRYQVRHKVT
ncbi:type II secretion system minor pseudopilin GspI [Acinetobacter baumannii]